MQPFPAHRLSVAPMMECTDRFARYLLRLISRHCLLYTEMVPAAAIAHGKHAQFLPFHQAEHPLAVQFGGNAGDELAACARWAQRYGYDEVNLNIGCPSDRVKSGRFGACLMAEPERVALMVRAMRSAVDLPVTVKTRIGIDDMDDYADLRNFVDRVAESGCRHFIVHARKAWLQGLSPKQNRDVPPLCYDSVYRLKQELPELEIVINGGIASIDEAEEHLRYVDGVMLGRAAYHTPWILAEADRRLFGDLESAPDRMTVYQAYLEFVDAELRDGTALSAMSRHVLGLFQGVPGARRFRRHISENAHRRGAGLGVLEDAAAALQL
ncbi:tRNA dihydrouridine(20/20a) synthase DusA [Methylonatrum kenyense]|uniref:tRNA dihydrouridine(20/20a) synthase DusA n=1 Tax=Methylonatrum kenyense TaxID=455253 RepID=UPI0020C0CC26|nr:tRNA dihydrouridine(20/20a) synthase DusA [Methylonatrum kenyense]MCK8516433.1 tRNA dihydrouridine(20/20a) synthase DusA [Methylonatrum kenyense]